MNQLIQVMTLTNLIIKPRKATCSIGQATDKTVTGEKGAEDNSMLIIGRRTCY